MRLCKNRCMKCCAFLLLACGNVCCQNNTPLPPQPAPPNFSVVRPLAPSTDTASWAYFLQHLPEQNTPILDYRGRPVGDQEKRFTVVAYDVGTQDLQQCADALMRLRAEYLFAQKRLAEIRFHFVSGDAFSFSAYCSGKVPVAGGNGVVFVSAPPKEPNRAALRRYLNLVYTYASTLSLAAELKDADDFRIGTVVIKPGSPGHCFIITDEAVTPSGERVYKLVEGYTPAQSLYVLRNTEEPSLGCWHRLKKGSPIVTASYEFTNYRLKKFE